MNFFLLIPLLLVFASCVMFLLMVAESMQLFNKENIQTAENSTKPSLLHLHLVSGFGGGENHSLTLYKMLYHAGYPVLLVIQHNSPLQQRLDHLQLPYITTYVSCVKIIPPLFRFILAYQLEKIFQHQHFDIILCNTEREADAAKKVATSLQTKIIFFRHIRSPLKNNKVLENLDGIIAVSKSIEHDLQAILSHNNATTKCLTTIPPFFSQEPFLTFKPRYDDKYDFFKNTFGITLHNSPILCMVANTSSRLQYKNYPLLLEAVAHLVHVKKASLQVVAVGGGAGKQKLEALSKQLKIDHCVHFLGFSKEVPEVLYHSDIFVLTSQWEAFGIVYLEAGLMKKPSIGATKTGAEDSIIDGVTGLLFENNNCISLVEKIEYLLNNQDLCKEMGMQAHNHVVNNFLNEKKLESLEELFHKIIQNKDES